jgi:peptidoglycan/LPS O-acetylase OafA/YrhL
LFGFFRIGEAHEKDRNFGLDLVRAVAILLVLTSHGRFLLPEFPGKILLANGGFFGVELFFVLSGFLIGTILIKESNGRLKT